MTDLSKLRAEFRAGLDGVTPGPWKESFNDICGHDSSDGDDIVIAAVGKSYGLRNSEYWVASKRHQIKANADHIARCSPDNIAALLDALDEAEWLAAAAPDLANALRHFLYVKDFSRWRPEYQKALEAARAALAKAGGGR